ncbi:GDP-fucose protein O-fucosyltransferase [Sesbania bispinosa]|nr:GDP-fucose protein O-fucosyltransferase [Sesbania bispinosa]
MKSKSHVHNGNGYASENTGGVGGGSGSSSSPSPPPSPRRSSGVLRCRRRLRPAKALSAGIMARRSVRYFFLLPVVYISGLLMCVGPFPFPFSALIGHAPLPASPGLNGFLIVEANGGLNQQRSASLLLQLNNDNSKKKLELKYFNLKEKRNSSIGGTGKGIGNEDNKFEFLLETTHSIAKGTEKAQFHSIVLKKLSDSCAISYLPYHFISTLDGYVKVVKELPEALLERHNYNKQSLTQVQAWAPVSYYLGVVYPILQKEGSICQPFSNECPSTIQFLRCLTNYKALRFSSSISAIGKKLVYRMMEKSSRTDGKYIAVHLRFEEDMVAFSCCVYDGGRAEKLEMDSVGMMLRGMGFDNNTSVYLASGKIYHAEIYLAPLIKMFPNLHTKESLATSDELAPFMGYSSQLAALDYTVCLFSEVFVTTQGGNFPHFLMGHRRFLYDGHAKTIIPDKRKLVVLLDTMNMSWRGFKDQMEDMLSESDRKGIMVPRVRKINRKTSVYTYPLPECRCLQQSHANQIDHNLDIPDNYSRAEA